MTCVGTARTLGASYRSWMSWVGGHCVCCKDRDAGNETSNWERWVLPEGQEGLSRQIFQAFQLHPEGREMYLSFLRRHVSITGALQHVITPPSLPCLCPPASSSPPTPAGPRLPCLCPGQAPPPPTASSLPWWAHCLLSQALLTSLCSLTSEMFTA